MVNYKNTISIYPYSHTLCKCKKKSCKYYTLLVNISICTQELVTF